MQRQRDTASGAGACGDEAGLLDTGYRARADLPERTEQRHALMVLADGESTRKVQEALLSVLIHEARFNDKALVDAVLQMGADTGTEPFKAPADRAYERARPRIAALLPTIRVPTLVLVGQYDSLTPPDLSREIAGGIPGARLEAVPDCGHLSTMERPDAVNRVLRLWLAG